MAHHTFAQRTELTLPMVVVSSFLPSQEQEGKDPLLPAANLPKSQSSIAWYNHRPNTPHATEDIVVFWDKILPLCTASDF